MIIYEKENKLNINFDNEVNEQPDLQISKEDGKTSVKIDGQESGSGSGGGVLVVPVTIDDSGMTMGKTYAEIESAFQNNMPCFIIEEEDGNYFSSMIRSANYGGSPSCQVSVVNFQLVDTTVRTNISIYVCDSKTDYPHIEF